MQHKIRNAFMAAALVTAGVGGGYGIASATAQSTTGVIVCYANQQLLTGGGTWEAGPGSSKELYHPEFNPGGDGHGMDTIARGSNQGAC